MRLPKIPKIFLWLGAIVAIISSFMLLAQTNPPVLPTMPSGQIKFGWNYPTDALIPFLITNSSPRAGSTNQIITNQITFTLYGSADLTNWMVLGSVVNQTNATVQIQPVGARFVTVTASNFWGESFFSDVLWLPPLPSTGTNLTVERLP